MFSLNRQSAKRWQAARNTPDIRRSVMDIINAPEAIAASKAHVGKSSRVWFHHLQEVLLQPEPGIELPATLLVPADGKGKSPAVLYFDDRGRWTELRRHGPLARMVGFLDKPAARRALMAVDLRGWGDTTPADLPYEIAGWGDRHRWIAYVSAAIGDPVLAMRIRDGLSGLAYLRARKDIDPDRIIIGGHGMGGIVALHVAAIDGKTVGVFATEILASFDLLATTESYAWSHEDFLPNVIKFYDVPDLVADLDMPTLLVNPLDAAKRPFSTDRAKVVYAAALKNGKRFQLLAAVDPGHGNQRQVDFVRACLQ